MSDAALGMTVYILAATVATAWLMSDLPLMTIAVAVAIWVPVGAGAGFYARRLAFGA